jgi:2'-hydroxyisoflavone reductase
VLGATPGGSFAADSAPPKEKLRILILGGTGFTGPHQVRYALERGHHVTLFNRGRRPQPWPGNVVELVGDRNTGDLKSLESGEWDVCIDNPTTLPFWVRDAGRVLKGRVRQFVFISTVSVYAANDKPGQDESAATAAYAGADPMAESQSTLGANMALYGPLKAVSEEESRRQFGDRTTIIRPGLIVGPVTRPTASPTGRCVSRAAARCWRRATARTRCSSSTHAISPSGRFGCASRARPARSTPPARPAR